jgi:GTP pyrophosphokinase
MDRIGLRVIVHSVPECYSVLGLLHAHFKPIPGTFDDYIGLPKANGYQSLHTCVYPVREISHKPIEIQIRTEMMHMESEHGTAAHWLYKNGNSSIKWDYSQDQWIKGLARQYQESYDSKEFIKILHQQVFRDHLVVFGNRGRIVRLAGQATVRDYLKITNIQVPESAVLKVNGIVSDMERRLRDGDSIEVIPKKTSPVDLPTISAGPYEL